MCHTAIPVLEATTPVFMGDVYHLLRLTIPSLDQHASVTLGLLANSVIKVIVSLVSLPALIYSKSSYVASWPLKYSPLMACKRILALI